MVGRFRGRVNRLAHELSQRGEVCCIGIWQNSASPSARLENRCSGRTYDFNIGSGTDAHAPVTLKQPAAYAESSA